MVLTGRGGFGNHINKPAEGVPSTPAPVQHFSSPSQTFRAGRGGWGNNVPIKNMPTMTPQEYLKEVHDAVDVEPKRYFTGRGGRGNIVRNDRKSSASSSSSAETQSLSSNSSTNSIWGRLKTTLSH